MFKVLKTFKGLTLYTNGCILKAFVGDLLIEILSLVYKEVCSYWTKVSFPGNQTWSPGIESFNFFSIFEKL